MKISSVIVAACISLVFSLFSCDKDKGSFKVEGNIKDLSLNQNLVGATVKIYQTPAGTGLMDFISQTTTDSNGDYEFTFKREKMEKYTIVVTKSNYFEATKDLPFSTMSLNETEVADIETTAKSWVKIRLTNLAPQSSDLLDYTKQNGKEDCAECCDAGMQTFGGALDTIFYCINDGNTSYSFLYSTNTIGSGIKTVNTTAFDTVDLVLEY